MKFYKIISQSFPSSNISSKFMTISKIFHIKNTISQPYKVPIKHFLFQNQNKNSIPFQFNFSQFFGNLFWNEKIQNQSTENKNNSSIHKINESNNYIFFKPSFEKSNYNLTPENLNSLNWKKIGKKNLFEIFNSIKNEFFFKF